MLRKAAAMVFACSALTIIGCSSSDETPATGGEGEPGSEAATAGIYRISFTNLTDGQPMTPPVVAIHDAGTHLYQIDSAASNQLREIAENGNNMPMVELAASMDTVSASGVAFVDASAP